MVYSDTSIYDFVVVNIKNLVTRGLNEITLQKLDRMILNNPKCIDYYKRYQQIIDT